MPLHSGLRSRYPDKPIRGDTRDTAAIFSERNSRVEKGENQFG